MRGVSLRRVGRQLSLVAVAVWLFTGVVVAHPAGGGAPAGERINDLHQLLLLIAVPIAVLVEGVIFYAVLRFRGNDEPTPTTENRRLEIAWTLATALVLVFVGVASYQVLAAPGVTAGPADSPSQPADAVEIHLTGSQWYWSVTYPEANVTIENAEVIYIPADRPLALTVTSTDVIHSVHVPELGLKQDAVPGQTHVIQSRVSTTGEYRLYCAEYCGAGHAQMQATIKVVPPDEFRTWLRSESDTN